MKIYRATKIILASILIPFLLQAQDAEKFSDRLFFGGNFGLQFGDYTYININPLAGYKITDKFSAGLSITYIYYKVNDDYYGYDYSTNVYGGSIFSRYLLFENLFAHAELEMLNMEVYDYFNNPKGRQTVPSLLLGAGYRMPMGMNSSFSIMALFEVLEDPYSPYQANPIIRIGVGFGF